MPRREEPVDWYAAMSEKLERRERRRKWVVLSVVVGGSLFLIFAFTAYVMLRDRLPRWLSWPWAAEPAPSEGDRPRQVQLGPRFVESFLEGNIEYQQLEPRTRMPTALKHVFCEMPLEVEVPGLDRGEKKKGFLVYRSGLSKGKIREYRIKNIVTGEKQDFEDVKVKRVGAVWVITREGHMQIRDLLEARMNQKLALPPAAVEAPSY